MSFILDALRRAEEKRHTDSLPNVGTPAFVSQAKSGLPWPWIIMTGLLLVIAAGFWFRPVSPVVSATVVPGDVSVTKPVRAVPLKVSKPPPLKPAPRPIPQPVPKVAINQAVQIHGQVRHEFVPAPVEIQSPVPVKTAVVPPPPEDPPSIREYERLSDQDIPFRQSFPKFSINVHVSADDPADRFILIDLKRFSEGDQTPVGITIEEITTEGVAASYRGRTVLVPPTGNPK